MACTTCHDTCISIACCLSNASDSSEQPAQEERKLKKRLSGSPNFFTFYNTKSVIHGSVSFASMSL